MPAWQASCVAIAGKGLLIEGPSGCGKSSLALTLVDRGAVLVGDDSLMIEAEGGRLIARPHPNTRGLLEVRNLGLIEMSVADKAAISLVIRLDETAPRYVDKAETAVLEGVGLPMLRLWPDGPALALKAEMALAQFGLDFG
jgi:serine kinase of HPr protein (carbohydrate metabolism regulator)